MILICVNSEKCKVLHVSTEADKLIVHIQCKVNSEARSVTAVGM